MGYKGIENEYTVFSKSPNGKLENFDFFSVYKDMLKRRNNKLGLVKNPQGTFSQLVSRLWLKNGGQVYRDVGTCEYASPEALSIREVVLAEKAGEIIVKVLNTALGDHSETYVMKRSATEVIDPKHTWGSHESYSVPENLWKETTEKETGKSAILKLHLMSRQLITGSGHLFCR